MSARDPLFDTLFRPTTVAPAIASAAPVRAAGTRSRAGNAMSRTRAALLDGARRSVEVSGTKITMAQVAAAAGVAKATLYNHFRTRDAVLVALLQDEVARIVDEFGGRPLADALGGAANALVRHPLLRALADSEPATVGTIGRIELTAAGWQAAREGVVTVLAAHSRGGTDTVLRWLASYLLSPAGPATIAADLDIMIAGLPEMSSGSDAHSANTEPREAQPA